jgi:RNA polymerase sigma factor (sigma-70 family)
VRVHDVPIDELVIAARDGDQAAWRELVRRYTGTVWAVARAYRLSPQDTEDVSQTAWLQLATHIRGLKDPAAVGSWLATTARREILRLLRRRGREVPADPHRPGRDVTDLEEAGEEVVIRAELRTIVGCGFARLPERCKTLLALLIQDPPPSYVEISQALGIPRGSIGPMRARCLGRLRKVTGL